MKMHHNFSIFEVHSPKMCFHAAVTAGIIANTFYPLLLEFQMPAVGGHLASGNHTTLWHTDPAAARPHGPRLAFPVFTKFSSHFLGNIFSEAYSFFAGGSL